MRLGWAVIPILAGLAAATAVPGATRRGSGEEGSLPTGWTSADFAHQLRRAADRARRELMEMPEIAWVDVAVRSTGDHAPLRVEARVGWEPGSALRPPDRRGAMASGVEAWFGSFASVEFVFLEFGEKAGAR